jgi:exodeoxyribonuclease V beta subunit
LSALGQLLKGGEKISAAELPDLLLGALLGARAAQVGPAAALANLSRARLVAGAQQAALQPAPVYSARFARDWAIASFSALVRDLPGPQAGESTRHLLADAAVHEELLAEAGDEALDGTADSSVAMLAMPAMQLASVSPAGDAPAVAHADVQAPAQGQADAQAVASAADLQPWHSFPRGAFAGNFLHEQLEWLAEQGFALDADPSLQQSLLRRCERNGWGNHSAEVLAWLRAVVTTRLPGVGQPLTGLGTLLPEMEFWFSSERGADARHIDRLCRRHLLDGLARPPLPDRQLRGMLMGFADLVFESGGRYWVLDYKSNALASHDAGYTADALQHAMAEHRYDVQAALYLLAMHRLLRQRLGERYDPAEHLGGAVYLFLRGIHGPEAGCCLIEPDAELLDALDDVLAGRIRELA